MSRTTGAVITIYWSEMGDPGRRRMLWGNVAVRSLKGTRITGDTWEIDSHFKWSKVKPRMDEILGASDKAVIIFPHGRNTAQSAQMSVHRYNC